MELRKSHFGQFWGCTTFPKCRGSHGAHEDGRPLGVPANKETKRLRVKAHEVFDKIWKSGEMTRGDAYIWMQQVLELKPEEAHIGRFSAEDCRRLIAATERRPHYEPAESQAEE